MSEPPSTAPSAPRIAAVVATCDRLSLLRDRSLLSVRGQTRLPDLLVVVDDSKKSLRRAVRDLVQGIDLPGCQVAYLENARSKGAAGAWNTAINFLFAETKDPGGLFVAILDDDDAWDATYLERCAAFAEEKRLDMVAAGFRRIEAAARVPEENRAPSALDAQDFLTGNPGIQGSNLFLRLTVLLAAGGFDEALPSATDRDLCIRIAEMGWVRYGPLPVVLVDHFAEPDRARLSTRGSPAKRDGLTAFWQKYVGRMTEDQKQAFSERAARLFGWRSPRNPKPQRRAGVEATPASLARAPFGQPFRLHVGVITSDPPTLAPLLMDLASLGPVGGVEYLAVLVLDNGCPLGALDAVVRDARAMGLRIAIADEDRQRRDAAAGAFGRAFRVRPRGRAEIAQARTMLQRYLGERLAADEGAIGWLLDDDMRVDARASAYLPWLPAFRNQGTDVLIGAYEGAAPAPAPTGLRVHLVDLLHNLHWLRNLARDAALPDRSAENARLSKRYPDYHYDLSRKHTGHLETPCWLEPAFHGETVAHAHSRLLAEAEGIAFGHPFTRPLVATMPLGPLAEARASVNRGGCTFILDHRALTRTPNMIMRMGDREARRSDMIWAIVNRHYRRMRIEEVGFPVHHTAKPAKVPGFDIVKVRGEIVGSALYAGLTEFLGARPRHALDFSPREVEEIRRLADMHLARRWRALERNFHRIAGLREAIRLEAGPDALQDLLAWLDRWATPEGLGRIRSGHEVFHGRGVEDFLASLRETADDYTAGTVDTGFIAAQLEIGAAGSAADRQVRAGGVR